MQGTLYCVCISRIKNLPEMDLKIFAVQKKKFLPDGWEHTDSIAPSPKLFSDTKKLKRDGLWNKKSFETFYKPQFIEQINNNSYAKDTLKRIVLELKNGKNVAIACYCGDYNICHRGIIGKLFENTGFLVEYN